VGPQPARKGGPQRRVVVKKNPTKNCGGCPPRGVLPRERGGLGCAQKPKAQNPWVGGGGPDGGGGCVGVFLGGGGQKNPSENREPRLCGGNTN